MSIFETPTNTSNNIHFKPIRNESKEEYAQFDYYLKSSSRDLNEVGMKFKLRESVVRNLAKKNRWEERAAAYDIQELDLQTQLSVEVLTSQEMNVHTMVEQHLKISALAQELGVKGLKYLNYALSQAETSNPIKPIITPADVVRLLDFGVRLARLTHGEATSITQTKKDVDYSKLSTEELHLLKQLTEKSNTSD